MIDDLAWLEERDRKGQKIIKVLMEQVERGIDFQGSAYSLFHTAVVLEDRVRERTCTLEQALRELEKSNRALSRAKEQTEAVRTRLTEAIESISEGFVHFDVNDRLVLCNSKFVEFWPGIDVVAQPGVSFAELSRWTVETGLVADMTEPAESWLSARLRRHRQPVEPLVVHLATGRWLQIRERRTREGGIVGIYTDISEIKLSEQRRREQELAEKSVLLQSTLDNLSQGVSVFDKTLRLVAWNDRFVELLDLPEWLVQPQASFEAMLHYRARRGDYGRHWAPPVAARMDMARQGRPLQAVQTLANGLILEVRRDPMPGGGFVTTYTDVTARERAAEQLREAKETLERRVVERTAELTSLNAQLRQEILERTKTQEALRLAKAEAEQANLSKTQFLAAASHDLLQPLNAARLFTAALSERPLHEKEGEYAARIDGALRSVEALLGILLDISKFDAGAIRAKRINFVIGDLLRALAQEYAPIAREAGLDLHVVPSSAIIETDPALLGRILRNFVSNAIRYTPSGRILLGCRRYGAMLRIEAWDTGLGIPQDRIVEIFQEFRQLNGRRGGDGGFGLGLSIVQRIAKMLGHRIDVRSRLDHGSVFAVEVPLGRGRISTERPETDELMTTDNLANALVVVVENEETICDGMRELLEGWGCQAITAPTAEAAREALTELGRSPDILIADFRLDDGITGVSAVEDLRSTFGSSFPSMIITADRSAHVVKLARRCGMHLLHKPIKPAKLRALMSHLLGAGSHIA